MSLQSGTILSGYFGRGQKVGNGKVHNVRL